VVAGVDQLGRSASEAMSTVADLLSRGIVIRAIREGVDSSTATGRAALGIMASLAELELELGRERRTAAATAGAVNRSPQSPRCRESLSGAADARRRRVSPLRWE
jgi:DNA invertase Pin-like site-specific DNA recombinase